MWGFTLIELIIVISIVAVLSSIVIIAVNPPKLLQESRDLKRMSDMASMAKANNQLRGYAVTSSIFQGQANKVYISIPDSTSTCANLGLPSLPSGWSYSCSNSTDYRNIDGTGWIPINFSALSIGSPLSNLPIDPINQTSTSQYYTYVTGGSYELTATLESEKYSDKATTDGGIDPSSLEIGSDLNLSPFTHGLIGYWKFDETGTTANDSSKFGNNGTMFSSTTATDLHLTSSSCKSISNKCAQFDGVDDYVGVPTAVSVANLSAYTIAGWFKTTSIASERMIYAEENTGSANPLLLIKINNGNAAGVFRAVQKGDGGTTNSGVSANGNFGDNLWHYFAWVRYSAGSFKLLIDNVSKGTSLINPGVTTINSVNIGSLRNSIKPFPGFIDEFAIYNRALSSSQIQAIYNATK